ncbi:hypothetical protein XH86_16235 [Bradyrhizobium guangdongense]|uniref:Uncharacterized protein n=1 Tax=Bradyrhizobium guangdongense TaxID=1325090 RepID=A0ABX6UFK2_9BRAD|nr:hypothetical protein X265_16230 [Bradyrhizobium guangdongense]QOZ60103.1 hypothetical protein XH86_16235 [Bradyrhizobium guangdongense]
MLRRDLVAFRFAVELTERIARATDVFLPAEAAAFTHTLSADHSYVDMSDVLPMLDVAEKSRIAIASR